jgi:hypothetical protein
VRGLTAPLTILVCWQFSHGSSAAPDGRGGRLNPRAECSGIATPSSISRCQPSLLTLGLLLWNVNAWSRLDRLMLDLESIGADWRVWWSRPSNPRRIPLRVT